MKSIARFLLYGFILAMMLAGVNGSGQSSASGVFVEPDVEVLHTFVGENIGDGFGWVGSDVGDINRDGAHDLIIPAPFYSQGGLERGKAYVYSGASGKLLNIETGKEGERFGYSASSAGDVNADGVPDYVVGGPGNDTVPGRVVVYSGKNHTPILELKGQPGELFGANATGAGDVDGDGYGDVFVGAPWASYTGFRAGRVMVFSGKNGALIWSRDGEQAGDFLGSGVGKVGPLDDDAAPDLVAGAFRAGLADGGTAYVYSGRSGDTLFEMTPFAPGTAETFSRFFASGAGDVNADGTPDIYVGDYNDKRGGGLGTGRAYIFSGRDGSRLYTFNAQDKGEGFGPGRGAGDVNGDGYGDVIVGAYTNSDGAPYAGKAYLYSGRDGSLMRTMTDQLPNDFAGVDALAVGDVNGDGLVDYLITGVNFFSTDLDHSYLIAGTE
jgi:hypothetical protein